LSLTLSPSWNWHGRTGRTAYVILGVVLFALKHNLDRIVAVYFGYDWSIFNYWIFDESGIENLDRHRGQFFAVLVLMAVPFVWIGVVLTLRRLRDADLPLLLVLLFFVPFLNLLFFLLLSLMPSADPKTTSKVAGKNRFFSRLIPDNEFGSAALGVLTTVILGLGFVVLSVYGLAEYGWGIFVGVPFFLGLNSVLIYGFHRPRPVGKCIAVAIISVFLAGISLLAIAVEGLFCVMMAAPLAMVFAIFGGLIGYVLQHRESFANSMQVSALVLFLLPALITLEHSQAPVSPLYEVQTSVIINAAPQRVWDNVVAFAELPTPDDWMFRTGIAYPMRAQITGSGAGAVRHCVFSTGAFVEPINVWDAPRLLKFGVTEQPPVMEEWSPYAKISPPHLENYLVSKQGQFLLTRLSDGRTLLEGTTWYENRFWPGAYWRLWSDFIIHRIHRRVLVHVKNLSEGQTSASGDEVSTVTR
jgi:uncharacterized membrane protein YhaH (DUF805 family)